MAELLPGQQEAAEVEVRQEGRNRGALRRAPIAILRLRGAPGRAPVSSITGAVSQLLMTDKSVPSATRRLTQRMSGPCGIVEK